MKNLKSLVLAGSFLGLIGCSDKDSNDISLSKKNTYWESMSGRINHTSFRAYDLGDGIYDIEEIIIVSHTPHGDAIDLTRPEYLCSKPTSTWKHYISPGFEEKAVILTTNTVKMTPEMRKSFSEVFTSLKNVK